ncbi:hypothetical protein [Pseudarthrobacter sp. H2]|uniref:hypothetical protein n=1 Tax=Pseudarthrobacter sp. H2 TaxID=3418415 RepID=UPI003CF7C1CF
MTHTTFDDWSRLPGTDVEFWRNGLRLGTGTIDMADSGSTIAWIISDPLAERLLLEKTNGIELRISREQAIRRMDPERSDRNCQV